MPLTHSRHSYQTIKTLITKPSNSLTVQTSTSWRIQAQERQLISKISSILLQRKNWQSLLKSFNLSPKLSPPIFLQILDKTQQNPSVSLDFFNWARSNHVGFKPDLKIHCKIFRILIGSGETHFPIKPLLDSFIGSYPSTHIAYYVFQACKGTNLHSLACSSVIECYAQKGSFFDGLQVYRNAILYGYFPNVNCLNVLLNVLDQFSEFKLAYCLYGSMIRNGVVSNLSTWTIISQIMCKDEKFDNVVKLLSSGVGNSPIFDNVIDGYSRIGNFEGAIDLVNEMCKRNLEPGFDTYGSILDGACKFSDENVVNMIMCTMKEKNLLPQDFSYEYNYVIKKFFDLGKSYGAEFLFNKARDNGVVLENSTFGYMLGAFCKGGRLDKAIELYHIILKEKIMIKNSCYQELAESICKGTPSENASQLLICLIMKGFRPCESEISKFIMKLGKKKSWKEVEELLNVILREDILPDSDCCCLLVNHYCSSGQIDSALLLHNTLDKAKRLWDVKTYNILLRKLLVEVRVDEALRIFESMRRNNVVNRASYVVMISGLSQVKDMKKTMQVHDEMLKRGLKPSSKTYRSLISVFR